LLFGGDAFSNERHLGKDCVFQPVKRLICMAKENIGDIQRQAVHDRTRGLIGQFFDLFVQVASTFDRNPLAGSPLSMPLYAQHRLQIRFDFFHSGQIINSAFLLSGKSLSQPRLSGSCTAGDDGQIGQLKEIASSHRLFSSNIDMVISQDHKAAL